MPRRTSSTLKREADPSAASAHLPALRRATPEINRRIPLPIAPGGLEVDFCWPARQLVVEVDEERTHDTRRARRNDPARDRALVAAGWRPIRFPEVELERCPDGVAADVRAALAAARISHT